MSYYIYPTDALQDVQGERNRQDEKWGSQRHLPDGTWIAILGEEFGEAAKAILERTNLREELIQVAAVAVAWVEALDARNLTETEIDRVMDQEIKRLDKVLAARLDKVLAAGE